MSKPTEQERDAFQDAYRDKCLSRLVPRFDPAVFTLDAQGEYLAPGVQSAWWGWIASKAQPAGVAVPDGYALAPRALIERIASDDEGLASLADFEELRAMLAAAPHPVSGEQPQALLDDDTFADEFMAWWEADGQLVRSGGGDYERAFAFEAWRHLMPKIVQLQTVPAAQDVAGLVEMLDSMVCAYRSAIATGYDRITGLGGQCDAVDYMLAAFPDYAKAKAMVAAHRAQQRGGA